MHSLLGQRITWTLQPITRWDSEQRCSVTTPGNERTGVVFSAGPVGGTAWVIPDEREPEEGYAVCVRIDPAGERHRQGSLELRRSKAEHHAYGLAALRVRQRLSSLYAGAVVKTDKYGNVFRDQPYGYSLPRGLADIRAR